MGLACEVYRHTIYFGKEIAKGVQVVDEPSVRTSTIPVSKSEYEVLAGFRYALRKFLRFSESQAHAQGLTPQQHQLLLALKGFPSRDWATISELAERLQLRHHSLVGIIDRCEKADLVVRLPDVEDGRVIDVHLTPTGEKVLETLSRAHRDELLRLSQDFLIIQQLLAQTSS